MGNLNDFYNAINVEWFVNYQRKISILGFMKGVGNNKFTPKYTYTTEQAIIMFFEKTTAPNASKGTYGAVIIIR